MRFQRDHAERVPGDPGKPGEENGANPRWLPALGLAVVLTLVAALARFAIDLLGVVFLIVVVGFSLRAISDWLTEADTVSGWSIGAVVLGLAGTVVVGTWLFGSSSLNPGAALSRRLPAPVVSTIGWLEARGWGQRVLLRAGPRPGPVQHAGGGGTGRAATGGGHLGTPAPVEGPSFSLRAPSAPPLQSSHGRGRKAQAPGVADAATVSDSAGAPAAPARAVVHETAPAPEPAQPIATGTSLTTTYDSVRVGTSVRLTAKVEAMEGEYLPAGRVVFYRGSEVLGTVRLRATPDGAIAILSTLDLAIGVHEISAEYTGGGGFAPSRSAAVRQTVRRQ